MIALENVGGVLHIEPNLFWGKIEYDNYGLDHRPHMVFSAVLYDLLCKKLI